MGVSWVHLSGLKGKREQYNGMMLVRTPHWPMLKPILSESAVAFEGMLTPRKCLITSATWQFTAVERRRRPVMTRAQVLWSSEPCDGEGAELRQERGLHGMGVLRECTCDISDRLQVAKRLVTSMGPCSHHGA